MRRLLPFLAAMGLSWVGWAACNAETIQARHARVELVSQQVNIVPAQQLLLGVHFVLEKHWHIYWTNPGDSGQPPVLQWQLPSGLSAGAIEWPRPEKLQRSSLADYGYQDDIVLLVPVRVASGLKDGDKVDLRRQAKWLICADVCIPDHAELHLSLPVASTPEHNQNQKALFAEAGKRLPQPWPHSWKASVVSGKDDFVLSISAGKPISAAEFFPLMPEQIENAAPQPLQTTPAGAKIILKKSDQLLKPVHLLKGLLVLGGAESYMVEAPVTPIRSGEQNK
ncbi:MAG TPA: protein-disulfide reductase DsbD domain-containing protein [Candidatus Angelobacter sp.]|nr:protein-disulfide reductase DsbD domain-containing protein [Candidatus Angelobacter sp.]